MNGPSIPDRDHLKPSRVQKQHAIRLICWLLTWIWAGVACGANQSDLKDPLSSSLITNLAQLRKTISQERRATCNFRLTGIVCAEGPADGVFFFQDESRTELVELGCEPHPVRVGQRVILEGTNCPVTHTDLGIRIGRVPVVDIDGSHPAVDGSGGIYLKAGQQPFKLTWFNHIFGCSLAVEYEGPGVKRAKIPDSALFRPQDNLIASSANSVPGVNYRCFEGPWDRLPDFFKILPVKTGTAPNFDISVRSRPEGAAIEFTGFIAAPRDGMYRFHIRSDDGAQLFMPEPEPQFAVIGSGSPPAPRQVVVGSVINTPEQDSQWAEVEGTLSLVAKSTSRTELELSSGDYRMRIRLADPRGEAPIYLLRSRVKVVGICRATATPGKHPQAGELIVPGWEYFRTLEAAAEFWPTFRSSKIGEVLHTDLTGAVTTVRLTGKLAADGVPKLVDETGEIKIVPLMPLPESKDETVEVLGQRVFADGEVSLRKAIIRKVAENPSAESGKKTVLTTAGQVQRLGREEAGREYPVKISGVLTWVAANYLAVVIQDSTRAIYVTFRPDGWKPDLPRAGECWEIEGFSNPADFSPIVRTTAARRLGPGLLPEPIRPTWDQLINGSLDAQYVELQGVITAVRGNRITLLTRAEKINVTFPEFAPEHLDSYENAVVRIRGCLFAEWNRDTRLLQINRGIRIGNPILTVDEPPPIDPFLAAKKNAAELLLFDPQASALQRVRVTGQIINEWDGTYYMTDGTNGMRFIPKVNPGLQSGDTVEVVGFPQLGGPTPVLREAVMRRTGVAPRPPPRVLTPTNLLQDECDSTLVQVEGTLLNLREGRFEQVLEMQSQLRTFMARVRPKHRKISALEPGSRLELTGVYVGQGGNRVEGREIAAFELLLIGPSDVRVLATPPWWTPQRLFALAAVLVGVLALAGVWISLLRRQVEERSVQLAREIETRQRVEQRRVMEQERTRVAQDLHDELGSGLTELTLLGSLAKNASIPPEKRDGYLDQITSAARTLVTGLDEIVWAVNPQYDSTASLATYYSLFAQRFLNLAGIACRLAVAESVPDFPLEPRLRHGTFLAFKEVLNNVVRHSGASEVRLAIAVTGAELIITVADNGRGITESGASPGKDGVAGLHQRMKKLGGWCVLQSVPEHGTTVELHLPLGKVIA